jgi:FlaA1/EpsC-like NDP-sugar epimerase
MKKNSQYNKVPYIILLIIHGLLLFYTFYKNKDRKTLLVLWLSIIGFAHNFDYVVLVLLKGYKYIPKFLKQKDFDNILGAIFSQSIYVPSTALFITSFRLGWKIKVLFGVYFAIIERLFLRLGIYYNNWWSTLYTLFFTPIYFFISDK